jgi:hypothetical protein
MIDFDNEIVSVVNGLGVIEMKRTGYRSIAEDLKTL